MKTITSHIHARVEKLAAEAIAAGLIEKCDRDADLYLLYQPGDLIPKKLTPIATAVTLLKLLGKVG
jgi:hypothetical protein